MKSNLRVLSDAGYRSLTILASERPEMFVNGVIDDSNMLEAEMRKIDSESIWAGARPLYRTIDELNDIKDRGPGADYRHAKIVGEALGELSPREYSDDLLWASLNCFPLAKYTSVRWQYTPRRSRKSPKTVSEMSRFVESHWLRCGPDGRRANATARLFWLSELARRFAPESIHLDEDELLKFLSENVNVYHQVLSRPLLLAIPTLMAKIIEVICEPGNDYLKQTKYISDLLMALNIRAGAQSLDMMAAGELDSLIRESLPPKDR